METIRFSPEIKKYRPVGNSSLIRPYGIGRTDCSVGTIIDNHPSRWGGRVETYPTPIGGGGII
jgi:hypothetical protein